MMKKLHNQERVMMRANFEGAVFIFTEMFLKACVLYIFAIGIPFFLIHLLIWYFK